MQFGRKLTISAVLLSSAVLPAQAEEMPYQEENHPPVTSGYLYLEDVSNGQVLWTMEGDTRIYPASMTKVMAGLILIENSTDLEQQILITDAMWAGLIEADASVAGFWPGDEPTVRDLLYGVLLPSGADADNALAMTIFGSTDELVRRMNERAAEYGMTGTHFTNCTGLHDPDHYSTVHDITILMEHALQNPMFCEIISAKKYTTGPLASAPEGLTMNSTCWPLINNGEDSFTIPGFLGGKTGFTNPAGRCLTSHAEFNGMHLILTTAHSDGFGHIADAAAVYSWMAEHYERKTLASAGTHLTDVQVIDTLPEVTFESVVPETVELDVPIDAEIELISTVPDRIQAPVTAGDSIGTVQITVNGQTVHESTVYAPVDAEYSRLAHMINAVKAFHAAHPAHFWILIVLGFLLLIVLILRIRLRIRRARRRARRRSRSNAHRKTGRS